ncbi:MAG: hypothetical protein RLP44_12940 [Aggregatilineales bacterium]
MMADFPFGNDADSDSTSNNDEIIQLICPICHEQNFEKVHLAGNSELGWASKGKTMWYFRMQKVEAYRCLHCDYLLMFGRE